MLHELADQVMSLYGDVNRKVGEFTRTTGLSCPPGCGACCHSEKVEATVLEMLPLSFHLFQTKQAELIIKRLERHPDNKQCIFFRPDFSQQGKWGCTQYPYRSLVCRLFGFAGKRDRKGVPRFSKCRVMAHPATPPETDSIVLFSEAGMQLTALHPSLGTQRLPINQAALQALYKVGMLLQMDGAKNCPGREEEQDNTRPPDKPSFPNCPITRKAI